MAKQRYINTHFWDDGYIVTLDPVEKLLFLYFLTNPLTEISGAYEIPLRRVAFDTGIDSDMVLKILRRFADADKMIYRDGWLLICNFIEHQSDSLKIVKGIQTSLSRCPDWIKDRVSIQYGYPIDTLSHLNLNLNSNLNTHKSEAGVCESASRQEEEETGTDAEYSDFRHSLTDWYGDALDADSLPPGSVADRDVRYLFANHFTLAEISEYYETAKHDQWRKGPVTISAIAKGIAHWRSGQTTTAAPERPDFSNCPLGCDPDTGLIYVSDNGHSGMKRCTHKPEQENQQNAEIRS